MISHADLLKLLHYNPDTGTFRYYEKPGRPVGTPTRYHNNIYLKLTIKRRTYFAHRLAWFYIYGSWPKVIDHINGNGCDNRLNNLRDSSCSENHANTGKYRTNITGFKGVCHTKFGTFRATVKKAGKQYYIGSFKTAEAAHRAYIEKAKELFGQFANAGLALLFLTSSAISAPCLTHSEARKRWPTVHLFWHASNNADNSRCWDNSPKPAESYDPRPAVKMLPPRVPDDLAAVAPNAPQAEIYYPEMIKGEGVIESPPLLWRQPWLSPDSILNWPLLLDIDRTPFVAWDRRIGQ